MNTFNPNKLRMSKWTNVGGTGSHKHYVVTDISMDEEGAIESCTMEAVGSHQERTVEWQELYDNRRWKSGWE
ncbi:TIGR02450 family Trp-rich protein [Corallincola platygyrae]|uniref:TIGR02450 family Trp-rich protein n=1 Tax=Corallincola platygyrae TaxID=1193278 RepID=A0ABW4XPU0_9GAMM